jgi:hypothetical protein
MNAEQAISIIALTCLAGCAPVHIHQYQAHGTLSTEDNAPSIGVRATTTANPNDPNSFGVAESPGAIGFLLEFLLQGIATTGDASHIRGTYSHGHIRNDTLLLQDPGKERAFGFRPIYAVPTGALIRIQHARIPQILDYGTYEMVIEYNLNGKSHSATGTVEYFHKSHWEIGVMGKGWN